MRKLTQSWLSQKPALQSIQIGATQALHPGQMVLQEEPIILAPADHKGHLLAFVRASSSVQGQILDFFSPLDGPAASRCRATMPSQAAVDADPLAWVTDGVIPWDTERFLKASMAFNFNAVGESVSQSLKIKLKCRTTAGNAFDDTEGHASHADATPIGSPCDLGVGLYELSCRAAHSCSPNCFWHAGEGGVRIMQSLINLEPGEELSVDYNAGGFLYQPVWQRRQKLQFTKEFLCECPRCSAHGDDTRRFSCATGQCDGHHLAHQPTAADSALLLPCSICQHEPPAAARDRFLKEEAELLFKLDEIDASNKRLLLKSKGLQPPHPHHSAAARIGMMQWELFYCDPRQMDHEASSRAAKAAIECLEAIAPTIPTRDIAYASLCLGDAQMHSAAERGAGPRWKE